jgi:hypothetical protein
MKFQFVRFVSSVTSVLVAGILLVACEKSDNGETSNAPVSGLMAFNLATDKAVGISLSGSPLINQPLSFENYTGNYLNVYSGNRLVQTIDYNTGSPLDSTSFNFEPQKYYSLFVAGTGGHYRNVIVNDNFDSLSVSAGQAYIRYVNAIPDSVAPTVSVVTNGDNVIDNNASFGAVSDFKAITAGDVSIKVSNGSTINKDRTITLEQQKVYTVLLAGVPGSTGNDSLQIRFIENGTLQQKAQKASSASSEATK